MITGLAYDWIANNIYYMNTNHVGVCDGTGTNCAVLIHDTKLEPLKIVLYPRSGFELILSLLLVYLIEKT